MNATLVAALLRQRVASPTRVVLAITFFGLPLLVTAAAPGMGFIPTDTFFALILGAGMVGQDVSAGVLPGLLARPVRVREYVLSRWLAAALGASALVALQAGMATGILWLRGAPPDVAATALKAAGSVLIVFGVSAVLLLFSCCVNGLGDLAVYLLASLFSEMLKGLGALKSWGWLERAGTEIGGFLTPRLDVAAALGPGFPAFAVISYFSTVTLCLALAIVVANRKELSYAAG